MALDAPRDVRGGVSGAAPPAAPPAPSNLTRVALSRALAVPLVVALTGFLPAYVSAQPGAGSRDTAYWLQLTLTVYAGGRLSAMVLARRRRLIQSAFWLFVYVAMGVAPLAQRVIGQVPTPVVGPPSDTAWAIALVLTGCLAFDAGALLAGRLPALLPRRPRPQASVSRRGLWLLIAVAYLGSALCVVKLGGPAVFFTSRQGISESVRTSGLTGGSGDSHVGSALVRGFGTVPALLALLFLIRWMTTSRTARRTPAAIAALAGLVVINVVVNNPVSNPRYWFLTVAFSLLFTVFPRSPVVYRAALVAGVVAALLLFPFLDRFRYESGAARRVQSTSVLEPLTLKDYDQSGMFANTMTYAKAGAGHSDGRQLAADLLFFVPRSVWHGKPMDSGVRVGRWMGMTNTNLSSPLWAELWLDFGPLGMAGGFLAVGWLSGRGDRRYARRTLEEGRPGTVTAVVVPLIAGYSFILLRGPLLQAAGRIAIAALCVALVSTLSEDRRKILR
jgi:hypothetical protein